MNDWKLKLVDPATDNTICVPRFVTRAYIQQYPEWTFIHSSDYLRRALFGQMHEAHGEPNAYPIPVLYKHCANTIYFRDSEEDFIRMNEFLGMIPRDKPIIPFPKIGEGYSRMKEFCPKLFTYMQEQINLIKYPDIWIL